MERQFVTNEKHFDIAVIIKSIMNQKIYSTYIESRLVVFITFIVKSVDCV